MVLKCQTLFFISPRGNLVGWDFQNLQMHVVHLQIPTHLSKTTHWTPSTKVSAYNFICVKDYSINMFRNMFCAFVISYPEFGESATCSDFSIKSNSFFSRSAGWISTIKISQDSFTFSKGDAKRNTSGLVRCYGGLVSR